MLPIDYWLLQCYPHAIPECFFHPGKSEEKGVFAVEPLSSRVSGEKWFPCC